MADGRPFDELIEAKHIVARNAEDVAHAQLMQPIDYGRSDCRVFLHRYVSPVDTGL
jgi:hypothetical protein